LLALQIIKVDPAQLAGAATRLWSAHLTGDAESMLSGNFEPHFPIKLLLKDLTYTIKTAGEDASVPTVSAARDVFQMAMNEKLGDLDMTAVVKLFEKNSVS
jgi:3-hydroxyisobutyrate dehydrogenase